MRLERERVQRKYLVIISITVLVFVIGIIAYGLVDKYFLTQHKAVAKVNDESITVGEFQKQVSYQRSQLVQQYINTYQTSQLFGNDPTLGNYFKSMLDQISTQLDSPDLIGEDVLNYMIDNLVIEQQARQLGVSVSDPEIEQSMQAAFGFYPNGTPTPQPTYPIISTSTLSPTQYALIRPTPANTVTSIGITPTTTFITESVITPTLNLTPTPSLTVTPYTIEGYKNQVQLYIDNLGDINFTEKDIKELLRHQLIRQKIAEKVTGDLPNTEERVWARHILVSTEGEANKVIERLNAGEDFSNLASELSQDTASKDIGGDLGWFGSGKMVKEFEEAAFKLKIGEVSQPVKSDFGYHIIQVLGHENVALTSSELETQRQTKFNDWLETQKESMKIEKFDVWKSTVPIEPALPAEYQY